MAVTVPLPTAVPAIVTRTALAYVYRNGVRSGDRVTDAQGRPVTRINAFGRALGEIQEVTVEAADHIAETVAVGDVVVPTGDLAVEIGGADFGAVRMKIVGVEGLEKVSTAEAVFDDLGARASQGQPKAARRGGDG